MQCYDVCAHTQASVDVEELTNKIHYMGIENEWQAPILSSTDV
jgi:hypothetical protein